MNAGDILYIPQHWWHHVRSFDCPNIAISLWFHPFKQTEDDDELLPGEEEDVRKMILYQLTIYLPYICVAPCKTWFSYATELPASTARTLFQYENRSRQQQRPCQSLLLARRRSWLKFHFTDMLVVNTCDVSCCR